MTTVGLSILINTKSPVQSDLIRKAEKCLWVQI